MANKKIWLGALVMALAFSLVLVGCDNDGSDDGNGGGDETSGYTFEVSDIGSAYGITIRGVNITTDITGGMTGFTVKADGVAQTVSEAYIYGDKPDSAYLSFGDGESLTTSSVVTISYDGTGAFAGKLDTFTDKACTWSSK
jgi:hypothetical protein